MSPHEAGELVRAHTRSREDFIALAEAMPQLVWISMPDGEITYFNSRWSEYVGIPLGELRTIGAQAVLHPDDVDRMQQAWRSAIELAEPYEIEYRLRRIPENTYRWFLARAMPVIENGVVTRWIGTATDIDAQRRTNESLQFVLECGEALSSLHDVTMICDRLAQIAIGRFADWCIVALAAGDGSYTIPAIAHRDPERLRFVETYRDRNPVRRGTGISRAIETNEPILAPTVDPQAVATAATDTDHLRALEALALESIMIVPISTGVTPALGAMTLVSSDPSRRFDASDLSVAQVVARQAAAALANARALEYERQTSATLRFLATATRRLSETFDVERALTGVLALATNDVADVAYWWKVEDRALRFAAVAARDRSWIAGLESLVGERPMRPEGEATILDLLAKGEPYTSSTLDRDEMRPALFEYAYEAFNTVNMGSAIVLPVLLKGKPAASLVFVRRAESPRYTDSEREILADLARHVGLALGQAELFQRERRISTELQRALLPHPEMLPRVPGIAFDVIYSPSSSDTQIGGDWYDAFALPDGSLVISVGDVTGRGLGAAGLMGKLRQALGVVPLYEADPARILDAVDLLLRQRSSTAIATVFLGIIDPQRRTLRYANAGHPYPLLRRDGKIVALQSHGLPLGLRDQSRGETVVTPLRGAEMLVLYTDGLVEATRDFVHGEETLREILSHDAVLHVKSPAKLICDACVPGGAPDDTAVMTLQFSTHPRWSFDSENARAAHDARADFVTHLREQRAQGDIAAAELIFGELVGNVVRHAPGPIEVQLAWNEAHPILHVTDRGRGFDRTPSLPDDVMKESGRGLFIVESLGVRMHVEYIRGYGSHVAVELPLTRAVRP